MRRSYEEFFYSVIFTLIFIGLVASANQNNSVTPFAVKDEPSCPVEIPPAVWRWGQRLPGGSPFANMEMAHVRINCKESALTEGTLIYDQYKIYVLNRSKEKTDWWDIENGKIFRATTILKNAVDSGEIILLLIPIEGGYRLIINRRTSNFAEEKDFKNGESYRQSFLKQIVFVLKIRERDKKFQDFFKNYVETKKLLIPVPFKVNIELVKTQLFEIIKAFNSYDLQKPKG
ncbi:MAG: hypothetical protein AABY64_08260 [Bdellovibrionota bacterium]